MRFWLLLPALMAPAVAAAQQPVPPDTVRARRDTLTREPMTMQAVTITTTAAQRDEPSGAAQVDPAIIRRAPAANAYDLLRQGAGLEVHDQGQGPGFASDVALRGFSSDHSTDIALWVDGVPVNEPVNGHAEGYNDFSLLFPQAISSIDVLKGPTSALFGNFALSGVISVRTLERASGFQLTQAVGRYGRMEGTLLTGVDGEETGAVIGLRGQREDGWRPHSGFELGQGHARLVQKLGEATTLDAGLELYAADWQSPGFLRDSLFEAGRSDVVANPSDGGFKRRAQERVSLRVLGGASLLWRSTLYATQGRWQLFLTTPPEGGLAEGSGSQSEEEDRRSGFGATSALSLAIPRGELTLGVEGRTDRSEYENWFTTDRHRDSSRTLVGARQSTGAVFMEASLDLGRHLRLSAGGRYDAQRTASTPAGGVETSASKSVVSPKLGVLLHLPGFGALYANASRGFRQTDGVIENPALPFITAWAYEAGLKVDRGPASGGIALFRMDVSNEQTFDPITLTSRSGGASRRQGVEVEARIRLSRWVSFDGDWTFNDAKYLQLITAGADTLDGARVFNTSRYVGTLGLAVAAPGGAWYARLGSNAVGDYTPFDEPGVELTPYALFHLSAGVRLAPESFLEVGLRNVADHRYPELRAGGFVAPGEPRTLFATLRLLRP